MTGETSTPAPPSAHELRRAFDCASKYTVGIEEEVMLLHPGTLELAPLAREVLDRLAGDSRFKLELPASQLEILTAPVDRVSDMAAALREGRRVLARAAEGAAAVAVAGVHPTSPGRGELQRLPAYAHTLEEYGPVARYEQVCALQVHVSVAGSARALAVYNSARSYLPQLAALAANAPFYEGRDSGLASVRPKLAQLLPRQGIPPAIESWESFEEILRWGARAGTFPGPRTWWWELRPHPRYGTVELRVPDGQSTVEEAEAVAAVAQSLMAWLGERHDGGEAPSPHATWRIEENRWSACRYGVEGTMADLDTGAPRPTRERLHDLLDALIPTARRFGAEGALERARGMVEANGAIAQRRVAREGGVPAVTRWLVERFLR